MLVKEITLLSEKEAIKSAGNAVVDSIEDSKGISGKALWGVNRILIPVAVAYQIYDGITRIMEVPKNLAREDYWKHVNVIVAELVAEFGLGWVSAELGAVLAGAAGTVVAPGAGSATMALAGFVVGAVAGFTAEHFLGDSVRSLTDRIVYTLYQKPMDTSPQNIPKTGKQGAANARDAVRNFSTAGNPAPARESLDRIINLSNYKS